MSLPRIKKATTIGTFAIVFSLLTSTLNGMNTTFSAEAGSLNGIGGEVSLSLIELNRTLPFSFSMSTGAFYTNNPGNANDARAIFINGNTGGTIVKHGYTFPLSADIGYRILGTESLAIHLGGGPRVALHRARFVFVGNNEDFVVRSNVFGVGGYLEGDLRLDERTSVILTGGADYFIPPTFTGHGTYYYTPDGVDDNPRNDYTYEDADAAIYQPALEIRIGIGIRITAAK